MKLYSCGIQMKLCSLVLFACIHSLLEAIENYSNPKTYFLYRDMVTWSEAEMTCISAGLNLGRIQTLATIPDLGLQDDSKSKDGCIWIGLRKSEYGVWLWSDGSNLSYTNWRHSYGLHEPGTGDCAVAAILYPFWWIAVACNETHPFICEKDEGKCHFVVYPHASIIAHNVKYEIRKSLNECLDICLASTEFVCHSFEYHSSQRYCQFNSGNRWDLYNYYFAQDADWDYYHRTCYTGIIVEELKSSISGIVFEEKKTYSASPTSIMLHSSITSSTFLITSCYEVWVTETHVLSNSSMEPISSSSLPEQDPVEELHLMTEAFKKRKKTLTKISVPDKRQSTTFVGLIAIIFMCIALGSIIVFDLLTFCQLLPSKTKRQLAKKSPFRWSGHLDVASKMQNAEAVPTINDKKKDSKIITKTCGIGVPCTYFYGDDTTARVWRRKDWKVRDNVKVDDTLFSFASAAISQDDNSDSTNNSYSKDILNSSSDQLENNLQIAKVANVEVQRKSSACDIAHPEKYFAEIGKEEVVMYTSSDNCFFHDSIDLISTDIRNAGQDMLRNRDQTEPPVVSIETAL